MACTVGRVYWQHFNALATPFIPLAGFNDHLTVQESCLDERGLVSCVAAGEWWIVKKRFSDVEQGSQFDFLTLLLTKALNRGLTCEEVSQLHYEELKDREGEAYRQDQDQCIDYVNDYFATFIRYEFLFDDEAQVSEVLAWCVTGVNHFILHRFIVTINHMKLIEVGADDRTCDEEQVSGLHKDKEEEVAMVTAADAVIQPLTVMIKPVDADIANVAVAATWQDYHLAGGANLPNIKLFKQV